MANNYCELSSWMDIPREKKDKAQEIIDRVRKELEDDDEGFGDCMVDTEVQVDEFRSGVWFHNDESANPEHVAEIAKALVEELEIDEPFYCSWAYTCSKPRIDEFGGGAFVVKRGHDTYWVDARQAVEDHINR